MKIEKHYFAGDDTVDVNEHKTLEIPVTLSKLLINAELDNDLKRIEGIRDSLELLEEWIKYFNRLIQSTKPAGANDLEEIQFIHAMINGIKRFKGKIY